jgi:hypothetical protein
MTTALLVDALLLANVVSQALWVGGLFGYVLIVWPAIIGDADGAFPRALLAQIAMRTAPWIYLAMGSALASFLLLWAMQALAVPTAGLIVYGATLGLLFANNVYGTVAAWPRIMLLPKPQAVQEWRRFRIRMAGALVLGLTSYSAAIVYLLQRG